MKEGNIKLGNMRIKTMQSQNPMFGYADQFYVLFENREKDPYKGLDYHTSLITDKIDELPAKDAFFLFKNCIDGLRRAAYPTRFEKFCDKVEHYYNKYNFIKCKREERLRREWEKENETND